MQSKAQQTLPKGTEQRDVIKSRIQSQIVRLSNQIKENLQDKKLVRENENHIQLLKLRNKLIDRCGQLSLLRLSHLEEVFKHYCTHVFKTGKHMTFDRLEYEKIHMTMDRFFLFLKDFQLTAAHIDQKQKEVLQKPLIITLFKKVASNARQLSFQEFIQCIEKLAVAYWDQKSIYSKKQEQNRLKFQRIKKMNEKRRKRKMGLQAQGQQQKKNSEQKQQQQQKEGEQEQEDEAKRKQKQKGKPQQIQNHENDDLIQELMNNKEIEDPNEQVRQVAARAKKQNAAVVSVLQKQHDQFQSLLKLSNEQKIEYYYQMINIDSVDSYKNKLTSLNLQNYINHQQTKQAGKALSESKLQAAQQLEQQRLNKLKAKMNEKKQKFKERPLPKPSNQQAIKQEENSRRRKQMKKQRQHAVKELKVQQVKKTELKAKNVTPKVEYKQGQVSWQMLQKLTLDHLKLKQFNLAKMYAPDEDDRYYMEEYGAKPRIASRLQARERQSLSIVQSTKMRAEQLQKKQRDKGSESVRRQTKRNNTTLSKNKI